MVVDALLVVSGAIAVVVADRRAVIAPATTFVLGCKPRIVTTSRKVERSQV